MTHSIDFQAAQIDPAVAYRPVNPHEEVEFSFVARTPGAFIYHCGTPPVLQHIANGMYGAIIVDPAQPLPPADVNYVLVQGEWYAQQVSGTQMSGDYQKMLNVMPDEVVFNGVAFQYNDHPLTAKVGQRVRLYVVNAGPNLSSAFHIIGGMFAAVYPDGDSNHALAGVSTYLIALGQGVVFDTIMQLQDAAASSGPNHRENHLVALQRLERVRLLCRHENHLAALYTMWIACNGDFDFSFQYLRKRIEWGCVLA